MNTTQSKLDCLRALLTEDYRYDYLWTAEILGKSYVCSTNGHVLLAIEGRADGDEPGPPVEKIAPWFSRPVVHRLSVARGKVFAGDPMWRADCADCAGFGYHECNHVECDDAHDCPHCEGTGFADATGWERCVLVGPCLLRRAYLARALSIFDDGEQLELIYDSPDEAVCIRGAAALAAVMPLRDVKGETHPRIEAAR